MSVYRSGTGIVKVDLITCDKGVNFLDEFLFLLRLKVGVPFGKTRLARAVLDQNELDRHRGGGEGGAGPSVKAILKRPFFFF